MRAALLIVALVACGGDREKKPPEPKPAEAPAAVRTGVRDVAVSQSHVCAVLATGQVACWGELEGPLEPLTTKPQIVKGVTDAVAISDEDCVLRGAKPAMCWDHDGVAEVPGTENAKKLVGDQWNPCFLLATGSVSCWKDKKLTAVPGLAKLRAIDSWAYNEWCYVRDTGAIECSGDHADDLGKTLPSYADAIDVVRVDQSVACVLRQGGVNTCFGRPEGGAEKWPKRADQITEQCVRGGDGVTCYAWSASSTEWLWQPKKLAGKPTALSCNAGTCCAVLAGDLACWGDNKNGRLADGMAATARPTKVEGLPPAARVLAGEDFTMAITKDGALYVWGDMGGGPHVPHELAEGPFEHVALAMIGAVTTSGRSVRMYGPNDERWGSEELPLLPADPTAIVIDGASNVCAALVDGTVRCLRDGPGDELVWQSIGGMTNVVSLAGVGGAICGATKAGAVVCLIDERDEGSDAPPPSRAVVVPGIAGARRIPVPFVERADGSVVEIERTEKKTWTVTPLPALAGITNIDTGGYAWSPTCGLQGAHGVCWLAFGGGKDGRGVLARSSKVATWTPAPVEGIGDVRAISAGNSHACAIDTSDAVWCWGDDRDGQLGRGRVTRRDEPARVQF